jgi:flavoprotein
MILKVELVPATSWGNNLRSEANLSKAQWDKLRKQCYRDANYKCEVCNGKGDKWPVECHEIWHYDDVNKVQTLRGLIALCPTCHKAKHLGRTLSVESQEVQDKVLRQLMKINDIDVDELEEYIVEVFQKHAERSQHRWSLDLSWLKAL